MSTPKESKRIKGKKLGFTFAGAEVWPDLSKVSFDPVDKDDTATFGSLTVGGTPMALTVGGITSTQKTSMWRYILDHVGETVEFMFAPNGNVTPTEDEPHFTGTCTIEKPAGISTEVNSTSTFEVEFTVETWEIVSTKPAGKSA